MLEVFPHNKEFHFTDHENFYKKKKTVSCYVTYEVVTSVGSPLSSVAGLACPIRSLTKRNHRLTLEMKTSHCNLYQSIETVSTS